MVFFIWALLISSNPALSGNVDYSLPETGSNWNDSTRVEAVGSSLRLEGAGKLFHFNEELFPQHMKHWLQHVNWL